MENRQAKTAPMLRHKIRWDDVSEELGISRMTLTTWRKSGDPIKNQVIDEAVQDVISKLRK